MTGPRMADGTLRLDGLGDFRSALSSMIAEGSLNELLRGIFKVQDLLVSSINSRGEIFEGHSRAQDLYADSAQFGPEMIPMPFGAGLINPYRIPALQAVESANFGVAAFARQVLTLNQLARIFGGVSSALTEAGLANDANSVDQTLAQMRRFIQESDNLFAGVGIYRDTKAQILQIFEQTELPMWGVSPQAVDDPRWIQAFVKAADKVVELPDVDTSLPPGVSGLGALPVLAAAILWGIGIVAAAVTAMYAIRKIIDALNSKAITARELILQRDREKEALRMKMIESGASPEEIDTAMKAFDEETARQVKSVPDGMGLGTVALIGAGLLALAFVFGGRR